MQGYCRKVKEKLNWNLEIRKNEKRIFLLFEFDDKMVESHKKALQLEIIYIFLHTD